MYLLIPSPPPQSPRLSQLIPASILAVSIHLPSILTSFSLSPSCSFLHCLHQFFHFPDLLPLLQLSDPFFNFYFLLLLFLSVSFCHFIPPLTFQDFPSTISSQSFCFTLLRGHLRTKTIGLKKKQKRKMIKKKKEKRKTKKEKKTRYEKEKKE